MTQGEFIAYLHDNGCNLNEDDEGKFYQVRKRDVLHASVYKSTMPVGEDERVMKKATMCIISHHMGINRPEEVREYYEEFFEPIIIANHLRK